MTPLLAFVTVGFGAPLINGAAGRAVEVTATTTVLLAGQQSGSQGGLALFLGWPEVAG